MTRAALSLLALCASLTAAPAAMAEGRDLLDWGRFFTNDVLGDGADRWRTGSYTVSVAYGPSDHVQGLPGEWGQMLEFRTRSEIVAPANLQRPAADDRPYAAMFSLGAHSHSQHGNYQLRTGLDLVFTGEQTGLGELQEWLHTGAGLEGTSDAVFEGQIGNALYPTLSFELARELGFANGRARLRPFVESQSGIESFMRIGADLTLGSFGEGAVMARDSTSGHLYQFVRSRSDRGFSLLLGADVARVWDSVLLPEEDGYVLEDTRSRLRAGVNYQGDQRGAFYGVTWLSEEFEAQDEGQLVGSMQLRLFF